MRSIYDIVADLCERTGNPTLARESLTLQDTPFRATPSDELRIDQWLPYLDALEAARTAETMGKAMIEKLPAGHKPKEVKLSLSVFIDTPRTKPLPSQPAAYPQGAPPPMSDEPCRIEEQPSKRALGEEVTGSVIEAVKKVMYEHSYMLMELRQDPLTGRMTEQLCPQPALVSVIYAAIRKHVQIYGVGGSLPKGTVSVDVKDSEGVAGCMIAMGNLLARIHGDGGHHTGKHGMLKSIEDAHEKVCRLRQVIAEEQRGANEPHYLIKIGGVRFSAVKNEKHYTPTREEAERISAEMARLDAQVTLPTKPSGECPSCGGRCGNTHGDACGLPAQPKPGYGALHPTVLKHTVSDEDPEQTWVLRSGSPGRVIVVRESAIEGLDVHTAEATDEEKALMSAEPDGVELIAAERRRQIVKEGWTSEHDDKHTGEELARVAALYATPEEDRDEDPLSIWPVSWDRSWWKPSADRKRELVKAGSLIAAEIDRLQRLEAKQQMNLAQSE